MTRDEIIINFQPLVENIVKKYNNHNFDEDLNSIGMIKCIKAVDKCISEGVTEPDKMQQRVIVWVKNAILDAIYVRNNVNNVDNVDDYELSDESDYAILYTDVKASLSGTTLKVFELLNEGYTEKEICEKLHISKSEYYRQTSKIKKVIWEN